MWSSIAAPGPLYLAGVLPWPRLPLEELPVMTRWVLMDAAEDVHHILVYLLLLAVPLHVVAALKHHFWDHHDVLRGRSEEHTSELQSLMRISYAVFCLKKKTTTNTIKYYTWYRLRN